MGLAEIIEHIGKKAQQDVDQTRKEAEGSAEKILEDAKREAEVARNEILRELEKEARLLKRERIIGARVEEKKKSLTVKQTLLDEVFRRAENKLRDLGEEEYVSLIKQLLVSNIDSGGEEIVISGGDKYLTKDSFKEDLKRALDKEGRPTDFRLSEGLSDEERGFVLRKKGVQFNYTFSNLFQLLREALEMEVAKELLE